MRDKPALAGRLLNELAELLGAYPPFRSRQVYKWILRGAASFDEMSDLPAPLRKDLEENYRLFSGAVSREQRGGDGTVKLAISLDDGAVIEGVILTDGEGRKTACLSTQAGCPAGCVFCKTGALGFKRNLSAPEIAGLFLRLKARENGISRIVIMGMGEPLLNLTELRKALAFFMDKDGLAVSKRKITVSTCGIENGIHSLAEHGPDIRLALSLTTAREELRGRLMPLSREHSLNQIKNALSVFQEKTGQRITLEMVLLRGINTGDADAEAAAEFARGLDTVINLIPWNPVENLSFEGKPLASPGQKEITAFASALAGRGLNVTRRFEKGRGISGACGQLGVVPE